MERRSLLTLTRLRVAIAVAAMALSLIALFVLLRPAGEESATAHATPTVAPTELAATTSTPAASPTVAPTADGLATPAPEATTDSIDPTTTPATSGTTTPGATVAVPPPGRAGPDVRLQIPAIGVDAWVIRMGLDSNGVMEVPRDAQLVAWYEFTSVPGAPGNAVMSAHLDYRGSTAVFWKLGDLRDGDRVTVLLEGEPIEYVVSNIYSTRPEDADLRAILGGRSGPETLTLITCGGIWDAAEGQYDHRVIVQATRVV